MPLTGPRSRVHKFKHLRVSSHLFPGHRTDPLTNRQTHLKTHRHTHKTHLTLQRKAANTSRAKSINTARTLFYGSEHEYIEPSCGRRKYRYRHVLGGVRRLSPSSSFGDYLQLEFDFDSCCTVTDHGQLQRPRRPLPRRRAQARSVRPDPIDIFELPDGLQFWDDASLSLPNENNPEPDLTNLLDVLSANDIYDAMNDNDDAESSMHFGSLFLRDTHHPSASDTEPHRGISTRAPNGNPQTPKKKNTPRFTPMAPKRGNKVIKIRSKVSKIDKIGKIGETKSKSTIKGKSKSTTSTGNSKSNKTSNVMELDPLADADAGYGYEVPEHLILHIPRNNATTPASTSTPSESNPNPIPIPSPLHSLGIPSPTPTTPPPPSPPPPPPHNTNIDTNIDIDINITTTPKPIPVQDCPLTSDISHLNLNLDTNPSDSDSVPGNVNAFSGPSFTLSPVDIFASSNRDRDASIPVQTGMCGIPTSTSVPSTLPSSSSSSSSSPDDIDIFMYSPPSPPPPPYIDSPQTQTQTAPCDYNAFSTPCFTLPSSSPSSSSSNNTLQSYSIPTPMNLNHYNNATAPPSNPAPFNAFSTLPSSSSENRQTPIDIPPSAPYNAFSTPCFILSPSSSSSSLSPSPFSSFSTNNHTHDTSTQPPTAIATDPPSYASTRTTPYNFFSGPSFTLPSSSLSFSSSASSASFSSNTNTSQRTHAPTSTSTTPVPRAPRAYTNTSLNQTQTQTQMQTQGSRLQRPTRFSDRHHPYHSKDTTHKDNKDTDKDVEMSDSTTTTHTLRRPVALTRTAKRDSAAVPPFIRDMYDRNRNRRSKLSQPKLGSDDDTPMADLRVGPNPINQNQNPTVDLDVIMDEPDIYPDSYSYSCPNLNFNQPNTNPYPYLNPTPTHAHPSLLPREPPIARLYSSF